MRVNKSNNWLINHKGCCAFSLGKRLRLKAPEMKMSGKKSLHSDSFPLRKKQHWVQDGEGLGEARLVNLLGQLVHRHVGRGRHQHLALGGRKGGGRAVQSCMGRRGGGSGTSLGVHWVGEWGGHIPSHGIPPSGNCGKIGNSAVLYSDVLRSVHQKPFVDINAQIICG